MFKKYEKLIEKIVDIKKSLNLFLIYCLIIFFPLNQQYHLRPYPSVDGFIIDYLIIKISIPEIILLLLFSLNFKEILKTASESNFYKFLIPFLLFLILAVARSNYAFLAWYENLIIFLLVLFGFYLYKNPQIINKKTLVLLIKVWLVFLTILGSVQFVRQSSVFNNYPLTGEFPYTEDYYHIKQKNIFFENLIPPYSIFSHSNIFGGYLVIIFILLNTLVGFDKKFLFIVLFNLILVGSVACFVAIFLYLISLKLKKEFIVLLLKITFFASVSIYFIYSYRYQAFLGDYSIYRRLYMFDLSLNYFISNPLNFLFGSGYYNYFSIVKNDLYRYELVRFFQPPHFAFNFLIWQYGFIFFGFLFFIFLKFFSKINVATLRLLVVVLVFFSFDHYLLTNHQFKILFLILLPYSLNLKNSIK